MLAIGVPVVLGALAWSTSIAALDDGDSTIDASAGHPSSQASGTPTAPPAPSQAPSPSPSPDVTASPAPPAAASPQTDDPFGLARLTPTGGGDAPDYDRGAFGQAWTDVDRNGCDTRNDILGRDLVEVVFKQGTNECKVLSGVLNDPYIGVPIEFVSGLDTSVLVQIDHVVPLAYAWRHGAWAWTNDQRLAYANDPMNLLAVDGETNIAKSDSGPSEWLPPNTAYLCRYLDGFVEVLVAYDLTIEPADYATLESLSPECT